MKKIVILFTFILLFTGCSLEKFDRSDIGIVIDKALGNNNRLANVQGDGYKYYLPRGMTIIDKSGYNTTIKYNEDKYYLYVDLISYYHKSKVEYIENNDSFISKTLSVKDKYGYIQIDKSPNNDNYFIEIIYNYAKIEAYVDKINLETAIYNSINILGSIKVNDIILETLIGDNILVYQEEQLDLFESKREEGAFLEVLKEYEKWEYEKQKPKDEDIILPDNIE